MFPFVVPSLIGLLPRRRCRCRCKLSLALLGVLPGVITMGGGREGGAETTSPACAMRGRPAGGRGRMEEVVGDVLCSPSRHVALGGGRGPPAGGGGAAGEMRVMQNISFGLERVNINMVLPRRDDNRRLFLRFRIITYSYFCISNQRR